VTAGSAVEAEAVAEAVSEAVAETARVLLRAVTLAGEAITGEGAETAAVAHSLIGNEGEGGPLYTSVPSAVLARDRALLAIVKVGEAFAFLSALTYGGPYALLRLGGVSSPVAEVGRGRAACLGESGADSAEPGRERTTDEGREGSHLWSARDLEEADRGRETVLGFFHVHAGDFFSL